jgi:hypothetical protein
MNERKALLATHRALIRHNKALSVLNFREYFLPAK